MSMQSTNTTAYDGVVNRPMREGLNGHGSKVFWFTGLSGAGKSTLSHQVEIRLHENHIRSYVFDGDNVRHGLCGDLEFSPEDRAENLRRIAEMARLFLDNGIICLTAFISPLKKDRALVRNIIGPGDFHEIYIKCPLRICEQRDVKGYYRKARLGQIRNYTGVSSPYEVPEAPDLVVDTGIHSIADCADQIHGFIIEKLDL